MTTRDDRSRGRRAAPPSSHELILSAVGIQLLHSQFPAIVARYSDDEFEKLSARGDLFVQRMQHAAIEEGLVIVPLVAGNVDGLPEPRLLVCKEHLRLLAALIEHRLPSLLPRLDLRRTRFGLERVRTSDDLVSIALSRAGLQRPPKLDGFHKHNRTELSVRYEFMPRRGSFLALTIELRRTFEIAVSARALHDKGLRLEGLRVSAEDREDDWFGIALRNEGADLIVMSTEGEVRIDSSRCRVDPSTAAFTALIEQAFSGKELERYKAAEWALQAEQCSGDGYLDRPQNIAEYLKRIGRLQVVPGLDISFSDLVSATTSGSDPSAVASPPPEYCFSADRTAVDTIPFRGLDLHGPFDGRRFQKKEPRILVVCPEDARNDADRFLRRFVEGMAKEGKQRFARGFVATYRLLKVLPQFLTISLPRPGSPQVGERYVRAIKDSFDPAQRPDLVIVIVRDEDAFIEVGNPYLAAKAFLLSQGLPSQEVRLSKIRSSPSNQQYILEDVAVASYAKMGGCPWTLMPALPLTNEIVLGMAYAEFGGPFRARQRYMGLTTVFTSDGTYVLAASSPRCRWEDYPQVLASSVKETIVRLVDQYAWGRGDIVRLVVHSPQQIKNQHIETVARVAMQELGAAVQLETAFLTIRHNHPYKVIDPRARGRKGLVELASGGTGFALVGQGVPDRGVIVNLGRSRRLVCVHGTILAKREGEGIPQPLLVELHRSSTYTNMTALAQQVYNFTGLSWASMKPISEPVTIHYARLLAKMLGRLDGHPDWSDRLLDTHLRTSRWFL